ncbi:MULTISPECIES: hypothetical protein [Geobacillus]|uniref:Glycogen biosynthesis protein GlgD n=1 Tax=Geobacillus thermocatenulatus TaxID=33938 RepID=A0A226QC33_9BACL|nr:MULTISPECIES: hypothetical protein [Geobacillus]ASS98482.1 glycogen biosynthesis protein GlgD [Geobacillus thermocatenulatus]KLR74187.1 glycogen biosynthesis protein GlgD [Geobacillus sp. T6]OXB89237.1 glycogen biosynthesis protein GlgD [Geobacillus thermocatenulatus]
MKRRLKQTNPEQKTPSGQNNNDLELGQDFDPVKLAKKQYEKTGGQPIRSKQRNG